MSTDAIFLFTRDLRVYDHPLLTKAAANHRKVYPLFVFNPVQANPDLNSYFSSKAFRFLCESVDDLAVSSPLTVTRGDPSLIILTIIRALPDIKTVYITADYSPFSKRRLEALRTTGITVVAEYDLLALVARGYKVFGAYERAVTTAGAIPVIPECTKLSHLPDGIVERVIPMNQIPDNTAEYPGKLTGGRLEAVKILNGLTHKKMSKYGALRNSPESGITTGLSAYLHFGCVSLREVYHKVKVPAFRREVIYRQFFYQLYLNYQKEFDEQWTATDGWSVDEHSPAFTKWCQGKTGVPAVDAGMRELNTTGYMHNRFRMITASYLIHDLKIHWSLGEKYFAKHLRDYDYAINRTNWGWVAGLKIYNRIHNTLRFNPETQLARFDKECKYVKKWIPELKDNSAKEILNWSSSGKSYV